MTIVKVADFAIMKPDGTLTRLHCKICGVVIGETGTRTLDRIRDPGGNIVERVMESFLRNDLYTEMKIAYDDGSAHVTNGCRTCLTTALTMDELAQLTRADEIDLELPHREGKPIAIVKIKAGGGIV